jgi:predicted TIM-barrel fold metal-dependent hydrolase
MVELPYVTDHWDALPQAERSAQKRFLLPSLVLDGYLFSGFSASAAGRKRSEELLPARPRTHAGYLDFLGKVLDLFAARGGRSVKLMTAYHRTLRFDPVPDMEARRLFAHGPELLRGEGLHRLQDNLAWHLLEMAAKRSLPLIVHTGYSVPTDRANPEHLVPLLTSPRLAGMKVDLSHSGWPNHGAALLMARTYPNCYLNLCWTPVLSRALGRRVLSEALDMLPADKILIGTDTGTAEAFFGAVLLIRSLLIEVLEEKVGTGQFGADTAQRLACAVLLDNPLAFYGISEEQVPALDAEPVAGCAPAEAPLPFLDPEG